MDEEQQQSLAQNLDLLAIRAKPQAGGADHTNDATRITAQRHPSREQGELYRNLDTDLDELRILIVKGGAGTQPLELGIAYWSRQQADERGYEAVSYCWGSDVTEIEVAGHTVQVSVSAKQALMSFRLADRDRYIWMDSVCLNQQDDVEKSYQVARMHHVYRNATRTLIWLGSDDGTVHSAITSIDALWAEIGVNTKDFLYFDDVLDAAWFEGTACVGIIELDPVPLVNFFSRPWFSRLWIMQEIALSKSSTIFCDKHELSPIKVHRVAWWLLYKRQFLSSDLRDLQRSIRTAAYMTAHADTAFSWFIKEMADAKPPVVWRDLIVDQQRYSVHEPKDRVYGMLGMYQHFTHQDSLPTLLLPDYSKSLVAIYRDATRYAMASGTINVLERVRRHCQENHEQQPWPTWVPCWHHPTDENLDELGLPRFHEADGGWSQPTKECADPDILTLYGFQVDSDKALGIRRLSYIIETGNDELDHLFREVSSLSGIDLNTAPAAAIKDLVATLLAGEDESRRAAADQDAKDFVTLREYNFKHKHYPLDLRRLRSDASKDEESATRICHRLWNTTCRRRFFITESGRYGLGPQTMSVGDIAVVLWGGKWPFILRPVPGNASFEMIGPCYVHGIMAGEAAEDFVADDYEATAFDIR